MKKKYYWIVGIIILLIIVYSVIDYLYFSGSCTFSRKYLFDKIEQANYCNTKDDCIRVYFGCYFVNKKEVERIENLIDSYQENCLEQEDCVHSDYDCINNKCS